jgi:hypothetical protein
LIGDQLQVFHTSSTRPPCHFWPKDGKRSRPTHFGCWIWTAWLGQLATDSTTSYGLCLGSSLYGWKGNFIELTIERVSCQNHMWGYENLRNKWTSRIYQCVVSPSFGPSARVSCRSPWGRDLRVGARPSPGPGRAPTLQYTPHSRHK